MRIRFLFIVKIFPALALTVGACSQEQKESPSPPVDPPSRSPRVVTLGRNAAEEIGILLVRVEMSPIAGVISIPASLRPNQDLEAQVGSLVEGRVQRVFVRVGTAVRAGQELMHIEGVEVGEIKSNFIKAKAQLKSAEANFQRQKTLLEEKVGSRKLFIEAQSEYEKALAGFNAEDKRIHSIGLTDGDLLKFVEHDPGAEESHSGGVLPIKAPIAGTVVERNVVIGQVVDASTTAFRIVDPSVLWADGQVYEKDIPRLSSRSDVRLTTTAYPGESFAGKIIYISPMVDERTRTITVRASIPNRNARLKPHMFGELHVPIGGAAPGLAIPAEALQNIEGSTCVFVASNDTTFELRPVVLGTTFDSRVEVSQGLKSGERVVTRGSFQLKSEMLREALEGGE